MSNYYYLAAQLPLLALDQPTYLGVREFLGEAQKWLGPAEFNVLGAAAIDDFRVRPGDPDALRRYKTFELALRRRLSQARPVTKATAVIAGADPLEREKNLSRLRWEFIESQEGEHYFDLDFLIFYRLKLEILERLQTFNKEKGIAVFDKLCEVNL